MEGDIRSSSSEEDMVELFHSTDGDLVSTPEKKMIELDFEDDLKKNLINRFSRETSRASSFHEISSDSDIELTCESLNSSCTSIRELEITYEHLNNSNSRILDTQNCVEFVASNMRK